MPTAHARAAVEVAAAMKAAAPEVANETEATEAPRSATTAASASASASSGTAACARATAGGRRVQKKKHRCWSCKAKVSLVEQEINKCLCGCVQQSGAMTCCVQHARPNASVGGVVPMISLAYSSTRTRAPRGCIVRGGKQVHVHVHTHVQTSNRSRIGRH